MGVVYTAFDTKLQRKVAVKRLRELAAAGIGRRAPARRFLREAQLLASLSHPNVLTVHDVGGVDPELYVVMELVDGWPMSRWISEAAPRPDWRRILDLYLQVGRGLSAAHQLGVVHRDVKPENILVARSGRVLIGDFGLAGPRRGGRRRPRIRRRRRSELTQTGTVLGTPAYMAPEQHDGKPADALSDQFSFCVSLYESLHGRRPFPGQTAAEIAGGRAIRRSAAGWRRRPARSRSRDRARPRRRCRHSVIRRWTRCWARSRAPRARRPVNPVLVAGAIGVVLAATATAAIVGTTHRRPQPAAVVSAAPAPAREAVVAPATRARRRADRAPRDDGRRRTPQARRAPARRRPEKAAAAQAHARALAWARRHPEIDARLLLDFADGAHADRNGAGVPRFAEQDSDGRVAADAERPRPAPARDLRDAARQLRQGTAAARIARRRATAAAPRCSRTARWPRCRPSTIGSPRSARRPTRRATRATSAARRKELKQALLRQTAAPQIQACFRDRNASRACGRRLTALARAYQVLAESFLVGHDCAEGAALDVMHSQVMFQSFGPDGGDPALRCRSERVFAAYRSCADAGEAAERRCLARVQAARRDGTAVLPDVREGQTPHPDPLPQRGEARFNRRTRAMRARW